MKRILFLVILSFLFGCEETTTSDPGGNSTSNSQASPSHASEDVSKISLEISMYDGDKAIKEESYDQIDDKLIDSKIRSINWNDSKHTYSVCLGKKFSFFEHLSVHGSFQPVDKKDMIIVQWGEMQQDKKITIRICENITSVDQIVALFLSYYKKDGKIKTLVKWDGGAE